MLLYRVYISLSWFPNEMDINTLTMRITFCAPSMCPGQSDITKRVKTIINNIKKKPRPFPKHPVVHACTTCYPCILMACSYL